MKSKNHVSINKTKQLTHLYTGKNKKLLKAYIFFLYYS